MKRDYKSQIRGSLRKPQVEKICSFSLKHGAILYNEAEVFSLSITNPNGRPMLPDLIGLFAQV